MVDKEFNESGQIEELRKHTSSNATLWIVIAVVVAVIGVAAGWWYFKAEEENKESRKPQPSIEQPVEKTGSLTEETAESEPVLTEDQQAFNRYFTDELLQSQLDLKDAGWDLSMFRKLVGNAFSAEFLTEMPGMTWEKWESTRKDVLQLARKVLAQPGFVRWLWNYHRETVVAAIRGADKVERVGQWASRAQPYFSGALPKAHSNILNEYYDIDKQLEQELNKQNYDTKRIRELTVQLDQTYRKLSESGLNRDDIYLFEFSRRRLAEGGRDLLDAYAMILEDLEKELSTEQGSSPEQKAE